MKSQKDIREKTNGFNSEDSLRKAAKLEPFKKNGKEKKIFLDDDDANDDLSFELGKKESILDYFDDSDEEFERYDDDDEDQWEEQDDDREEDEWHDEEDQEPVTIRGLGNPIF